MINEETIQMWYDLARGYYFGKNGMEENNEEALKWFKKAAIAGHAEAQYRLGECYEKGFGASEDLNEAAFWYAKAALNGDKDGKKGLRNLKRYVDSKLWKELAEIDGLADEEEAETVDEFFNLGVSYYYGKGVEVDYERAVACYLRAAWQGNKSAENNLGLCFEVGNGVSQNIELAIYFYERAAKAGNATAQCNLGWLYYYGKKIAKDYEKALYWYKKSEAKGNGRAMYELGVVYGQGLAVKKDCAKAQEYFLKAKEKGYKNAKSGLDWIRKLQDEERDKAWAEKTAALRKSINEYEELLDKKYSTAVQSEAKPTVGGCTGTTGGYTAQRKRASSLSTDYEAQVAEEKRIAAEKERAYNEKKRREDAFKRFKLDLQRGMGYHYGERLRDFKYSFSISTWSEEYKVSVQAKVELSERYFGDAYRNSVREYLSKYIQKSVASQMESAGFAHAFSVELSVEFTAY